MTDRFTGKVAVVTGAAGGIGRAAAVRLAAEGGRVVAVDLANTALDEVVAAVEQAGSEGRAVVADVRESADVARYVREAEAAFGGVHIFFNNAGINGAAGTSLVDYPEETFDQVLAVNVKGVWLGMKHVVPTMRRHGGGVIVNTASVAGLRASPNVAYGASKHAVIGMTRTAAQQLAPDAIRVNAICPGPIDTEMMRFVERSGDPDSPDQVEQEFKARTAFGRYGTAAEVAALVAFLASNDASYITGGIYTVDAGWTL